PHPEILTVLAALSQANSSSSSCQGVQLTAVLKCYKPFIEAYGMELPTPTTLPDYDTLHAMRMGLLTGRAYEAQPEVCAYGNALVTCLKPNWRCLDNVMYLKLGQPTARKAGLYYSDLFVTQYQCSERALYLFMEKCTHSCTKRVRVEYGGMEATQVCSDALDAFPAFPETGEPCRGINIFLSCIYHIYYPHCGTDGAEILCESNRAATLAQVAWCDNNPAYDVLKCGLQQPGEPQQPQQLQHTSPAAGSSVIWALPLLLLSVYSIF
ncbi:hypothetical protein PENTCL1PPCAC_20819, partial [Pristionchus entomophagus]